MVPESLRAGKIFLRKTLIRVRFGLACAMLLPGIAHTVHGAQVAPADSVWFSEVRRLEKTYGGHLGFVAKNLRTGEVIGVNGSERFPTASLIKLPIMAAFFDRVDSGYLDPRQRVMLTAADKKPGSGILQFLSDSLSCTLRDAVRLMIDLSDNTATNLVLDRLGATHEERLGIVNSFLASRGLTNTRLLNRLYSVETKKNTPEAIRYGIGVATPEDIVLLLEQLYDSTLVSRSSCGEMCAILGTQFYGEMIPRLLPVWEVPSIRIAHKTGGIAETKVDAGLVFSDRADIAMAIFVDKHPDHAESIDNRAAALVAHVARAAWNHFTGMTGYEERRVNTADVDWNIVPGGAWGIYRSGASLFPHVQRHQGWTASDGMFYPPFPHYLDSSVAVFVPKKFRELPSGSNVIIHFHGHGNDNMGVLEQDTIPQAMVAQGINAILVLAQGPYRARDSFSGKMEEEGGLRTLVQDVLATMKREGVVRDTLLNMVLVSGFSGGYRPAAFAVKSGGLADKIRVVFLFDALYAYRENFENWLLAGDGELFGAYTAHLEGEYAALSAAVTPGAASRVHISRSPVEHTSVVREFIGEWLSSLGPEWRITE